MILKFLLIAVISLTGLVSCEQEISEKDIRKLRTLKEKFGDKVTERLSKK